MFCLNSGTSQEHGAELPHQPPDCSLAPLHPTLHSVHVLFVTITSSWVTNYVISASSVARRVLERGPGITLPLSAISSSVLRGQLISRAAAIVSHLQDPGVTRLQRGGRAQPAPVAQLSPLCSHTATPILFSTGCFGFGCLGNGNLQFPVPTPLL